MRFIYILLTLVFSIFSCKSHKILLKKTVTDAVVLLSFEKAGKEGRYFLKSRKVIIKNQNYDLLDWVPPTSELGLLLQKRGIEDYSIPSECAAFRIDEEDTYFSEHLYYWLNDEDDLSIIFSIKGRVAVLEKLPKDKKYGIFNHYSCLIVVDTLNVPYCKIIGIDSCYSTNLGWLNDNHYFKANKNSFKVNYCD